MRVISGPRFPVFLDGVQALSATCLFRPVFRLDFTLAVLLMLKGNFRNHFFMNISKYPMKWPQMQYKKFQNILFYQCYKCSTLIDPFPSPHLTSLFIYKNHGILSVCDISKLSPYFLNTHLGNKVSPILPQSNCHSPCCLKCPGGKASLFAWEHHIGKRKKITIY